MTDTHKSTEKHIDVDIEAKFVVFRSSRTLRIIRIHVLFRIRIFITFYYSLFIFLDHRRNIWVKNK